MAYAINMVQRVSDGAIYTGGGFVEINTPRNYQLCAFFGGNPDNVPQLVSGLPGGEYRIIPFWMPGNEGQNLPNYNGTVFSNFTAGVNANTVTINGFERDPFFTGGFGDLYSQWQANGFPTLIFFFTESQNVNLFGGEARFWDGSLGLEEFVGLYWQEATLYGTESGEYSGVPVTDFSGEEVQWAFLMRG